MNAEEDSLWPPFPDDCLGLRTFPEILEWLIGSFFRGQMTSWGGRWPDDIPSCMNMANVLLNGLERPKPPRVKREEVEDEAERLQRLRSGEGKYRIPEGIVEMAVRELRLSQEWLTYLGDMARAWDSESPAQWNREDSPRRYRRGVVREAIRATVEPVQSLIAESGPSPHTVSQPDLLLALSGVERLMAYYRAVFGGRSDELAELDRFLDDDRKAYLLIRELAGRGKTALLVHWVDSLRARSDWEVAFVPVSRVFETDSARAALGLWADQLAAFHGGSPPDEVPSTDALKGRVASLLRATPPVGRKLLLVLDGLDEALDWSLGQNLFPVTLPDSVKVVVGVRQVAHEDAPETIRRLGWPPEQTSRLRLPLLERLSIEDALTHAGYALDVPQLTALAVEQILRISAGDPILVRLLASDLASGSATPSELTTREPGLELYFQQFLNDVDAQTENSDDVSYLLGLCSASMGTLAREDCAALREADGDDSGPRRPWRAVDIRSAAKAAQRFLVGDGEKGGGYAFQLTTFQDLYSESLGAAERQRFENAFLEWGRLSWANRPESCPPYLRSHWIGHLARSNEWQVAHDALLRCETSNNGLEHPWARMRLRHEGSYAGYLSDVEVLFSHADAVGDLATIFECDLIRNAIRELYFGLPLELLIGLVEIGTPEGRWPVSAALDVARMMGEELDALMALASHVSDGSRAQLLEEIENMADFFRDDDDDGDPEFFTWLMPLVPRADRARVLRRALADIRLARNRLSQAGFFVDLLPYLAVAERHDVAEESLAAGMATAKKDLGAIKALVRVLPHLLPERRAEVVAQSLEVVRSSHAVRGESAIALAWLIPHLPDSERSSVQDEALHIARSIGDPKQRAPALAELSRTLPEDERPNLENEALDAVDAIESGSERCWVLLEVLPLLSPPSRTIALEEATQAAYSLAASRDGQRLLSLVAAFASEELAQKMLADALEAHRLASRNDPERIRTLAALIPQLPPGDREARTAEAIEAARAIAPGVLGRNEVHPLTHLIPLVDGREQEDLIRDAISAALAIPETSARVESLLQLCQHLSSPEKQNLLAEVRNAPRDDDDAPRTAGWLLALAPCVPASEQAELVGEALRAADSARDPFPWCLELLRRYAGLQEPYREEVLDAAVAMGERSIEEGWSGSSVLFRLLPHLDEAQRQSFLEEVLAMMRASEPTSWKLEELAFYLPYVRQPQRQDVLRDVLDEVRVRRMDSWRTSWLLGLLPHLTPGEQEAVLTARAKTTWPSAPDGHADREQAIVHPMMKALHEVGRDDLCMQLWVRWLRATGKQTERLFRVAQEAPQLAEAFPTLASDIALTVSRSASWHW